MRNNVNIKSILEKFRPLKPWLICVCVFLILRYTGLLSAVSSGTQYALLQTGAMDADPETEVSDRNFDYDFSLVDLNKKEIDMKSFKGKTLFINVWATWCGPCRVEMPSIQNLYNSVDHEKVAFIMLSVDQKDPYEKVNAFVKEKEYSFPVYLPSKALPGQLQVRSIPTTYVVSKEGKIVFREAGAANYDTDEFKNFLKSLY